MLDNHGSAEGAASALRRDPEIELCREIANRQKHFTLSPRSHPSPAIAGATIRQGYGMGRFGKGAYGVGEQSVTLNLEMERDAMPAICVARSSKNSPAYFRDVSPI
jgi:hypothetical protein